MTCRACKLCTDMFGQMGLGWVCVLRVATMRVMTTFFFSITLKPKKSDSTLNNNRPERARLELIGTPWQVAKEIEARVWGRKLLSKLMDKCDSLSFFLPLCNYPSLPLQNEGRAHSSSLPSRHCSSNGVQHHMLCSPPFATSSC